MNSIKDSSFRWPSIAFPDQWGKWIYFLVNNGMDGSIPEEEARTRIIYNFIISCSVLILAPFPLIFTLLGLTPGGYFLCLAGFISIVVSFLLNHLKYHALGRLVGIYMGIFTFSLGFIFYGLNAGFIHGISVVVALPIFYFSKVSHKIAASLSSCFLALLLIYLFWDISPLYGEPSNVTALFGFMTLFVTLLLVSYFASTNFINWVYMTKNATLIEELTIRNEELKNFSYSTSHDLKQPLQNILNFVSLFKEKKGDRLDKEEKIYLDFIQEAGNRLEHLIESLLKHSVLGQNENFEMVDCAQIFEEVQSDLSTYIVENKCRIYSDSLPSIVANREDLRVVFQNLLSNAIKFQKIGEPPIVQIKAEEWGSHWKFSVCDNGMGIEEHLKEKIFQIFQKGHDHQHINGTGIGLANCKKIIHLHGGVIWVESHIGEGSHFHFTIRKMKPTAK